MCVVRVLLDCVCVVCMVWLCTVCRQCVVPHLYDRRDRAKDEAFLEKEAKEEEQRLKLEEEIERYRKGTDHIHTHTFTHTFTPKPHTLRREGGARGGAGGGPHALRGTSQPGARKGPSHRCHCPWCLFVLCAYLMLDVGSLLIGFDHSRLSSQLPRDPICIH